VTLGRILVVDDDPWIQRSATSALGQRGYQVTLAGDAQGAFAVASKTRPDLIFTSVSLPAIDGWSWWERLRTLPACADTPIVFLLSVLDPSTEIQGAGPRDQRLRKPFRVEDLERAIVTSLGGESVQSQVGQSPGSQAQGNQAPGNQAQDNRAILGQSKIGQSTVSGSSSTPSLSLVSETPGMPVVKPSAGHRPLSALRGQIDQIGLSSILVVLEMERKTGILLVERPEGTARLFLRKGRVIRADTDQPRLSSQAAVFEALAWTGGSFDFLTGDIGGVDEIQASTTYLLIEGARRYDEANDPRPAKREENKL
jgi:CheY-like chemotaxis protein